jgi:hypothetical protein
LALLPLPATSLQSEPGGIVKCTKQIKENMYGMMAKPSNNINNESLQVGMYSLFVGISIFSTVKEI